MPAAYDPRHDADPFETALTVQGRKYPMGRIMALFKADGPETAKRYAISEWWLDPYTRGPGVHSHPEDDAFYVLAGTMSILVDRRWVEAPAGSFILVPGSVSHDFENRGSTRAGLLNLKMAGSFEDDMPANARWFAEHPPADTRVFAQDGGRPAEPDC